MITDFFRLFSIAFVFLFFASVTLDSKATVVEAFITIGEELEKNILYQDSTIVVTKNGVYSKRTGNKIIFTPADDWVEEDFFTQQQKYCEQNSK